MDELDPAAERQSLPLPDLVALCRMAGRSKRRKDVRRARLRRHMIQCAIDSGLWPVVGMVPGASEYFGLPF